MAVLLYLLILHRAKKVNPTSVDILGCNLSRYLVYSSPRQALFRFRNKIKMVNRNNQNSCRLRVRGRSHAVAVEELREDVLSQIERVDAGSGEPAFDRSRNLRAPGARDLLDVLYPPSEPRENYNLHANFEDEESVQIKPGTSRLIHRALAAFQSSREDFRRFIRG